MKLIQGDCLEVMKALPDNSVDSCVTDPPYGLKFMGKKWDYNVPTVEQWKEVYRVMKPGAFLLSFGGTRTYHRMVVNIEDAGFEIRDQIQWLYGSGFPKSTNISKDIDKMEGAERKVVGDNPNCRPNCAGKQTRALAAPITVQPITAPATPEAIQWDGWGTALKPANEPICLARKPLSEKTVAANVLKWGTGGLNIDGCRVEIDPVADVSQIRTMKRSKKLEQNGWGMNQNKNDNPQVVSPKGRFPANVITDGSDEVVGLFPNTGISSGGRIGKKEISGINIVPAGQYEAGNPGFGDSGSAARFFYCAKASKTDRNEGLNSPRADAGRASGGFNTHPTVKPTSLMQYLTKLITPTGGIVLDPFVGSGSTGKACIRDGFSFVGIDKDIESVVIAEKRVLHEQSKTHKIWTELFE